MGKKNVDKRKVWLALLVVFAAVFVVSAVLLGLDLWEKRQGEFPQKDAVLQTLTYEGKDYVLNDTLETFLLIGLDTFGDTGTTDSYNNNRQADFLLLLVLDNETKTYKAVHVNRDTMAEMNILDVASNKIGTVTKQIALSHTYGNGREVSCQNTANAVSKLLMGVDIDHYLSATMDTVAVCNDLVGGVTVEILDDFTATDAAMVQGTTLTLTGEQALRYVRSRQGLDEPTNNRRMQRQKQYLEALYDRVRRQAAADEGFIARAVLQLEEGSLVSDCLGNRLTVLVEKLASYEMQGMYDLAGESKMGDEWVEFYPDRESVLKTVVECFYKEEK